MTLLVQQVIQRCRQSSREMIKVTTKKIADQPTVRVVYGNEAVWFTDIQAALRFAHDYNGSHVQKIDKAGEVTHDWDWVAAGWQEKG